MVQGPSTTMSRRLKTLNCTERVLNHVNTRKFILSMKQQTITERVTVLKSLREQKERIIREELDRTRPACSNLDLIPVYYEKFMSVANKNYKDNTKIFVFLIFFLYSPASCVRRGVRGGVRSRIAKLLNVSNAAVSIQFSDAKILFDKHRGFRAETERLYQLIMKE